MLKLKKPKDSKSLAKTVALISDEKIARDIVLLDMSEIENTPCDYFLICTCETENHVRGLSDDIMRASKDMGLGKPRIEGLTACEWVIIDFFNVVVHLMLEDTRRHFKLENLWGDSRFLELSDTKRLIKLDKDKLKSFIAN